MSNVIVIGGGPAGVLGAATAASNGHSVTLIERNSRIGRKLMITGKGRCNVTNACADIKQFVDNVPVNGCFLYSAFSSFMSYDTMELFESLGVPLKVERGERVFPVSDKSVDIVDALFKYLRQTRVKVITGRVSSVSVTPASKDNDLPCVNGVTLDCGTFLPADQVILATGGMSYQSTGSTGDGYRMAEELGHTIAPLSPSLVPIESDDLSCKQMQGLSLKNVEIKIFENQSQKLVYKDFGEMLFTHFGVSGPVILSASSHIRKVEPGMYTLHIDLKPALTAEQLDARLLRDFDKEKNKDYQNSLSALLPSKMIPIFVEKSGVDSQKKVNQITKEDRAQIVHLLKDFPVSLKSFRPINEAIITSGGISVKEINPKTMESKLVSGLYFAGEIIDTDAYTGGFNLQIAFSTGYLAGKSI